MKYILFLIFQKDEMHFIFVSQAFLKKNHAILFYDKSQSITSPFSSYGNQYNICWRHFETWMTSKKRVHTYHISLLLWHNSIVRKWYIDGNHAQSLHSRPWPYVSDMEMDGHYQVKTNLKQSPNPQEYHPCVVNFLYPR